MKFAAVPRLIQITLLHERADRPDYRSPADADQSGNAVQRRVALAGFAIEVIDDGGSHALFRSGQVVCKVDRFMSYERVRWSGSHVVLPMIVPNEPRTCIEIKPLFMFVLSIANWRKPQWMDLYTNKTALIVVVPYSHESPVHPAPPLSRGIAYGICFDPRSEIAAPISDRAPNTDEPWTS